MLTSEDLQEIGQYFNSKLEKTKAKIQNERNAKIINYKIRAFIENVRDKLKRFEPISLVDHQNTISNKASQLDRIELTIGQVLNTVQKLTNIEATPMESPSQDTLTREGVTDNDVSDNDKAPSRQRSNERQSINTAQKMQELVENQKISLTDLRDKPAANYS